MQALALALVLAGGPGPGSEPEQLIVDAEAALDAGRWEAAGDAFRRAYERMSPRERAGDLGEHVVTEGVAAYDRAYRKDGETRHLVHAQDLLQAAAADRGGSMPTAELRAEADRIAALLERIEHDDTPAEPAPQRPEASEDRPPPPSRDERRIDGPGVALVTVGTIVLGAGVGLLANGVTVPARARDRIADRGGSTPDDDAYLEEAERLRTGFVAGGAVAIAVGVAGVVWGAVRLARHRRGPAAVAPMLDPSTRGLSAQFRF